MTVQELYYEFHLLINKNNEDVKINIEKLHFVTIFNRELDRWLSETLNSLDNSLKVAYLQELLISNKPLEIIEKNKFKIINWAGNEAKKSIFFGYIDLDYIENSRENGFEVSIKERKNNFTFFVRNLNSFGQETNETITDSIDLINTKDIEKFHFSNIDNNIIFKNSAFIKDDNSNSKIIDSINFNNDIVFYKKLDGKYGINYLGYFIPKKQNISNQYYELVNFGDYQNLQNIEYKFSFYKMKRNNLYNLFPLQKDFKYKSLEDFKFGFARFELPNGKKGWLSLDGTEYLDD